MSSQLKKEVLKMQERKFWANPKKFGTKQFSHSNKENAYPHLMFSFTNKKVIDVWPSEVKSTKWMEKSEVIQKRYSENIGRYQSHIISLVIYII